MHRLSLFLSPLEVRPVGDPIFGLSEDSLFPFLFLFHMASQVRPKKMEVVPHYLPKVSTDG